MTTPYERGARPTPRPSPDDAGDSSGVRSVQRALDILRLISPARRTITIRDVVDETGLAKTTVIRLLHTLEGSGLLWESERGYTAGPRLWHWAHLAREVWEVPENLRQLLRSSTAELKETINIYVRRGTHRVCIAQEEGPRALRLVVNVGDELPLWGGASAKVLLIGAPEDLLKRIAAGAPPHARSVSDLEASVRQTELDEYAVSHGEREAGLSAVAVPLRDGSGRVVAAVSLSGPTTRFDDERVQTFAAALTVLAKDLARHGFDRAVGG